jgi:23S rRNA G2445 N2-methylase RlmL
MQMPRDHEPTALYAMVHPGLEEVAADEIRAELDGDVKRAEHGFVVFRLAEIDRGVLQLRTTEDVFLYAWGTDQLSYRATDLDGIRRWTAKDANWADLLRIHHSIRPKPKGKPTYRLVVQMTGEHGYRRVDALKAMARGLTGKLPASWRPAEENASVEIWLTIHGATAVCGLRLSDRTMRHRTWKLEHFPASLRPTMAAAMVRLAQIKPGNVVLDPMCGAGTILAEAWFASRRLRLGVHVQPSGSSGMAAANVEPHAVTLLGGDIDPHHVRFAKTNLRQLAEVPIETWDARRLPLADASVDRVICNLPFGKQLSTPQEIGPLYQRAVKEMERVLKPRGRAVLLVAEVAALKDAIRPVGWKQEQFVPVRVLGQRAVIMAYRKTAR